MMILPLCSSSTIRLSDNNMPQYTPSGSSIKYHYKDLNHYKPCSYIVVVHLQASIALAFTSAMSHAFIASILICAVALAFSAVRENKYSRKREAAAGAPGVPGAPSVEAQHVARQTN